jgi:hypothetical protein
MALTILVSPEADENRLVYNPIPVVFEDTTYGSNGNAYVKFDIYLGVPGGGSPALYSSHKLRFDENDIAQIDPHKILSTALSSSIDPTDLNTFQTCIYDWAQVYYVGRTYVNNAAVGANAIVSTHLIWNGVYDWDEFLTFNFNNEWRRYYGGTPLNATDLGWFMTSIQSGWNVQLDDRIIFKHRATNAPLDNYYLEVVSDNGTFLIESDIRANTTQKEISNINVGPYDIANATTSGTGITVSSGALPIIDADTTSYTVKTLNSSLVDNSIEFTFNMVERCSKYENYKLLFLDRIGSYISLNFNLVSKKNRSVKRETYRKRIGHYTTTKGKYMPELDGRSLRTIDTTLDDKFTINSDWLSEAESDMVLELLQSPEVFHIDESGNTRAIQILTNSIQEKTRRNDYLINYKFDFEYSNKDNTQNI